MRASVIDLVLEPILFHKKGKRNVITGLPKIYYLCPDSMLPSAGIRRLYRHIDLLNKAGFDAAILHVQKGFRRQDMQQVPISYLNDASPESNTVIVIPEGLIHIMEVLQNLPVRRFVIALNWDYVFKNIPDGMDWRTFGIERALVISPAIGHMITWSMGLPCHVLDSSIDHQRYYYDPDLKRPQLSYIKRKGINIDELKRMLGARNNAYINKIKWVGLDGLSEDEYAREIGRSSIFVNISLAEGYPTSCLEAMAAGTVVVAYDSLCGGNILCGKEPEQNCVLAPNGDYLALAYALEPVLKDCIYGRMEKWRSIIVGGLKTAASVTVEREKRSLISFWRKVCWTHNGINSEL